MGILYIKVVIYMNILLTGLQGVGKTTILNRLHDTLSFERSGFYTEPVVLDNIVQRFLMYSFLDYQDSFTIGIYKALLFIPSGVVAQIILSNIKNNELAGNILAGAFANLVGSIAMYYLLFNNQKSPLLYGLIISFFSGGASGFLTQFIYNRLKSFGLIKANTLPNSLNI